MPAPAGAPPQPFPQKAAFVDRMFDVLRLGLLEDYHILLMQKVAASIPFMDDRIGVLMTKFYLVLNAEYFNYLIFCD